VVPASPGIHLPFLHIHLLLGVTYNACFYVSFRGAGAPQAADGSASLHLRCTFSVLFISATWCSNIVVWLSRCVPQVRRRQLIVAPAFTWNSSRDYRTGCNIVMPAVPFLRFSLCAAGLPQAADGGASLHLDSERLALLQKQAPCFVILDFR
jgi:hypothetical protein